MNKRPILRWIIALSAVFLIGLGFLFVIALHVISVEVRAACSDAQRDFSGECVAALSQYAESSDHSFKDRNRAIWALGEIGDARAVPVLKRISLGSLQTGHCNTSSGICEYSVKKSIALCEGLNIVRYVWRWI